MSILPIDTGRYGTKEMLDIFKEQKKIDYQLDIEAAAALSQSEIGLISTSIAKDIAKKTLDNKNYPKINGKYYSRYLLEKGAANPLKGYQLKYIYFIDKAKEKDLTVPIIPFSKIKEMGIGMYKGEKLGIDSLKVKHNISNVEKVVQYQPQCSN